MRRRARLSDDALDRAAPPLWRVWQVTKANLVALIIVIVGYALVGALVLYNAREDQRSDDRESAERRAALCDAIVEKGPEALARAFGQPTENNPDLEAYKDDLRETLGFCAEPK